MSDSSNPFNLLAEQYDQWYATPFGKAAFRQEIACLRLVQPQYLGTWLEAGVGTGRFAQELGIEYGLDPSAQMLQMAAARGIVTQLAQAEAMPYPDASFDGVMMTFALCFMQKPTLALQESRRILRPQGTLLLGIVPAGSPWGEFYAGKGAAGHPIYAQAVFRTVAELISLTEDTGFVLKDTASALLSAPQEMPDPASMPIPGASETAGFVALRWQMPDTVERTNTIR